MAVIASSFRVRTETADAVTGYVALLRAIANVPMQPFRDKLEELGLEDVSSYGMSGNFMFNAQGRDTPSLESRISEGLGARAFVRTRAEMARIVGADPFRELSTAAVLFLAAPVTRSARRAIAGLELEGHRPRISGRTIFFVHPTRLRGKRSAIDFEKLAGVAATARSSRVVEAILMRMRG